MSEHATSRIPGADGAGSTGEDSAAPEQRIAVVVPCYNEAPTVATVVHDFAAVLPQATIYVFDNNSTDDTASVAREAGATVIPSPLQGKGNVMSHMSRVVDADIYIVVDGDATYPADAAPRMLEIFRERDLDMLVGTRLQKYDTTAFRAFHRFGNDMITGMIRLLFRAPLTDVLSGYRVLSRRFVDIVRLRMGGFEVETEMTAQALTKRLAVGETPIEYGTRPEGSESKLNTWNDGFLIAKCILMLFKDYKPLAFFSVLAFVFAVASLVSGIAPILDYVEMRYVLHVPRAILAAGLGILSLVCLTAGIILDTIAKLHQENIEFWKQHLHHGS